MPGQIIGTLSTSRTIAHKEETTQPGPVSFSADPLGVLSGNAKVELPGLRPSEQARLDRERHGWGHRYEPKVADADGRAKFKRICNDLDAEVSELRASLVNETVPDEASGVMAEIQRLLELLYDCPFGQGESLKSVVVALQSQLNNAQWTAKHVDFLHAAVQHLRVRSVVNDQTVDAMNELIKEHGLDVFRGTVCDSPVVTTYVIRKTDNP
jgi:hypothetical protein